MENFIYILIEVVCFVPAIVLHELSHGYAAYKLGDPTAKNAGRLTLNPIAHVDPFGTVLLPLMLMMANMPVFGYAKPVPYNPRYFKDVRKGDLIVGLAGPAANFAQALVAAAVAWIIWIVLPVQTLVYTSTVFAWFYLVFLPEFALINLFFMFFNLLPIPPLDGSSIFAFILPPKCLPQYYRIQQYAMPVFMIALIVFPYVFGVNPISGYLNLTAVNLANLLFPFGI